MIGFVVAILPICDYYPTTTFALQTEIKSGALHQSPIYDLLADTSRRCLRMRVESPLLRNFHRPGRVRVIYGYRPPPTTVKRPAKSQCSRLGRAERRRGVKGPKMNNYG